MVRAKFKCVRIERFKSMVRDTTASVPNKYVDA